MFSNIIFIAAFFVALYLIVKAAVRNGIIEARRMMDNPPGTVMNDGISKKTCPDCRREHDCDYPKCPFCGHEY